MNCRCTALQLAKSSKDGCKHVRLSVSLLLTFRSQCVTAQTRTAVYRGRWRDLLPRSFHISPEAEGEMWKPKAIDLNVARNQQYIFVLLCE